MVGKSLVFLKVISEPFSPKTGFPTVGNGINVVMRNQFTTAYL